jgi:plastocyanin
MKKITILTMFLMLGLGLGCSSSQTSSNGMTYKWNGTGADIQVSEDNYKIHMPTSFPAGNDIFHITNNSSMTHTFKIKGNGVERSTPEIPANGSTDLAVTLSPGEYDVICTMLGHADLGMRLEVDVTKGH